MQIDSLRPIKSTRERRRMRSFAFARSAAHVIRPRARAPANYRQQAAVSSRAAGEWLAQFKRTLERQARQIRIKSRQIGA